MAQKPICCCWFSSVAIFASLMLGSTSVAVVLFLGRADTCLALFSIVRYCLFCFWILQSSCSFYYERKTNFLYGKYAKKKKLHHQNIHIGRIVDFNVCVCKFFQVVPRFSIRFSILRNKQSDSRDAQILPVDQLSEHQGSRYKCNLVYLIEMAYNYIDSTTKGQHNAWMTCYFLHLLNICAITFIEYSRVSSESILVHVV